MSVEVRMPEVSDSAEEGIVVTWFVEPGAYVREGDLVAEVQVEKVSMDVEAPASGWLARTLIEQGGVVAQRDVIAVIEEEEPASVEGEQDADRDEPPAEARPESPRTGDRVIASPSARRVARKRGVDLADVTGTGPGGRIIEDDVLAATTSQAGARMVATPDTETPTVEPLSPQRRTIARRLGTWLAETAQLTLTAEADVTELRARLEDWSQTWGHRASYTAAAVAACAAALRDHPRMAVRFTDERLELASDLDIGIAVELEDALIVPVVRRADHLGLEALNREVAALAGRARSGELTAEETRGGVFSVTNLGAYGIDAFTPLLNPPQAGILGVGEARQRPAVVDGQVVPRDLMVLSLTFDHRVLDGAPAAAFLADVVVRLEQPDRLP